MRAKHWHIHNQLSPFYIMPFASQRITKCFQKILALKQPNLAMNVAIHDFLAGWDSFSHKIPKNCGTILKLCISGLDLKPKTINLKWTINFRHIEPFFLLKSSLFSVLKSSFILFNWFSQTVFTYVRCLKVFWTCSQNIYVVGICKNENLQVFHTIYADHLARVLNGYNIR